MDGEGDVGGGGKLAEAAGVLLLQPEASLEIDLTGAIATRHQQLDGRLRTLPTRAFGRADADLQRLLSFSHVSSVTPGRARLLNSRSA